VSGYLSECSEFCARIAGRLTDSLFHNFSRERHRPAGVCCVVSHFDRALSLHIAENLFGRSACPCACFVCLNPSVTGVQSSSFACFVCLHHSFTDVQSSFGSDSGRPNDDTRTQLQSAVDQNVSISHLHLLMGDFEIKFERRPGLLTKGVRS
jgi:hypothetical protein